MCIRDSSRVGPTENPKATFRPPADFFEGINQGALDRPDFWLNLRPMEIFPMIANCDQKTVSGQRKYLLQSSVTRYSMASSTDENPSPSIANSRAIGMNCLALGLLLSNSVFKSIRSISVLAAS